jgi:4-oxalocrotonate tautomerase
LSYARIDIDPEGGVMPVIEVNLYDRRVTEESVPKIIEELTEGLVRATDESVREHVWVIVEGVSPKNWGIAGKPSA